MTSIAQLIKTSEYACTGRYQVRASATSFLNELSISPPLSLSLSIYLSFCLSISPTLSVVEGMSYVIRNELELKTLAKKVQSVETDSFYPPTNQRADGSLHALLNIRNPKTRNNQLIKVNTVCRRSSDTLYIVTYYKKWVTTSWTYSTEQGFLILLLELFD